MRYLLILIAATFYLSEGFSQSSSGSKDEYVSFTLRNGSLKDIPLYIPNVMNPNLSPKGNSGVTLKVGQEIFFKYRSKRRILLIVDTSLNGEVLQVQDLIKKRQKEIDLELDN